MGEGNQPGPQQLRPILETGSQPLVIEKAFQTMLL
jgi:hypothetical protein